MSYGCALASTVLDLLPQKRTHEEKRSGLAALAFLAISHTLCAQCTGDLNNDQTVDLHDLLSLLVHYGDSCSNDPDAVPPLHISEIHYNPNST